MKINVKVMKTNQQLSVECQPNDTILVLRQKIAQQLSTGQDDLRLICNASILNNAKTIDESRISESSTVMVTITKTPAQISQQISQPPVISAGSPAPPPATQPANPFGQMNKQQAMNMMSNPMFQSMMQQPGVFDQMFNNPMMQEIMEKNSEMKQVMDDPETKKMMMDMMSDPVKLQEMMRSADMQMAQLQNEPAAMQMMQKLQNDMQEAQDKHMHSMLGVQNPHQEGDFLPKAPASGDPQKVANGASIEVEWLPKDYCSCLKKINYKPVPAAPQQYSQPSTAQNPFGMGGGMGGMGGFGGMPGMGGGMPDMASMQQMMGNPMMMQQMETVLNTPGMLEMMLSNPMLQAQLDQMTGGNPMIKQMMSDPNQMRAMMQQYKQMTQGGGFGGMGANPFGAAANPFANMNSASGQPGAPAINDLRAKYSIQLQQVKDVLGDSVDETEVLQLLGVYNGNVEMTINMLMK